MRWALHVFGHSISLVLCATWLGGAPGTALIIASQSGTAAQTRIDPSVSSKRTSHTALALLMALRNGQPLVYGIQLSTTHPQMPIGSTLLCSDSGRLSRGMHGDSADFNNSFIFTWTHAGVSRAWADVEVGQVGNAAANPLTFDSTQSPAPFALWSSAARPG